jgi:hypothetical protein
MFAAAGLRAYGRGIVQTSTRTKQVACPRLWPSLYLR